MNFSVGLVVNKSHVFFRSCVAFQERNRIVGVAAANQRVTNMKNTIVGFKRILGRKFNDPFVQQEMKYLPYNIVPQPDGSLGIKVRVYFCFSLLWQMTTQPANMWNRSDVEIKPNAQELVFYEYPSN